ncbi:hypothetical protein CAPTEDRAFT_193161 [Capitella teleta]|uniref:Uncharacterized protein n=1 Tax=Capitella teleta TaxID=283909 RepID=R7UWL4_CAPTE|nr:hypothetical protein CAPTEDRAFT_193161 [Capitella teleta]|eukprot:ELU07791.1 hypothetical protein CAPTEDRAFT_193161 [Capitella teleta]
MGEYAATLNGNDRALSPINFHLLSSNNHQSLFSTTAAEVVGCSAGSLIQQQAVISERNFMNMQDENLLVSEKAANMKNQQQLSPGLSDSISDQSLEEPSLLRKTNSKGDLSGAGYREMGSTNGDDQAKNGMNGVSSDAVNSVITSLNQLGLSEPNTSGINSPNCSLAITSSLPTSSTPNFWSTGSAEDTYVQGFPSNVNGAVTFQNFPSSTNALFNANHPMAPQMGMSGMPPQHHRRAITGQQQQQNFPQQRNPGGMFLNNTKTYPPWSNGNPNQQNSWSQQQQQQQQQNSSNPWGSMQHSQRRSMTMPNVNPVGASMKKSLSPNMNPSMLISPSKYRRSTSFPGQYRAQQAGMGNSKSALDFSSLEDPRDGLLGLHQCCTYGHTVLNT